MARARRPQPADRPVEPRVARLRRDRRPRRSAPRWRDQRDGRSRRACRRCRPRAGRGPQPWQPTSGSRRRRRPARRAAVPSRHRATPCRRTALAGRADGVRLLHPAVRRRDRPPAAPSAAVAAQVTRPDPAALLAIAREAADAGAEVALQWWAKASTLDISEKAGPDDLVSQADTETEAAVHRVLIEHRPDDAVLGEETGLRTGSSGVRWVVDPIDGTTNYLYGRPDWAVSVAAIDETGRVLAGVVAEPALGRVTWAGAGGGTWADGVQVLPLAQSDLGRAVIEVNL